MPADAESGGPLPEKKPVEEVAFINAKMDAVEMRDNSKKSVPKFVGLSKEELSNFADDPFWVRTRRVLFVAFWVIWIAMIVAAATIIAVTPRCPAKPPQKWWDSGVVYRVFVKSFKDSNEDGKGDLIGLQSDLKYIKSLDVTAISLSSFFQTAPPNETDLSSASDPLAIAGKDVTEFMEPDSAIGSLKDVKDLVKKARKIGLKLLLEVDPNYSSDQHQNFKDSASGLAAMKDFYIWRNSSGPSDPPSLWSSKGQQVWHFHADRREWFYSRAGKDYPEFNYGSSGVKAEIKRMLSYWLDEGIDGFVIQSAAFLYEDPSNNDGYVNQPASVRFIAEIRKLIDEFSANSGKDVALVVDGRDTTGDQSVQNSFYHDGTNPGAHIVLNNGFLDGITCGRSSSGKCITDLVKKAQKHHTDSVAKLNVEVQRLWPNWAASGPSVGRLGSRLTKPELKDAVNLMMLTMEGSAFVWFGDEIGMSGNVFSPMQWDNSANAGFSSGEPWMPVGADAPRVNVKFERALGNDRSVLRTFNTTNSLRSKPAFAYGKMKLIVDTNDLLFSFIRHAEGHPPFYVAINFGDADTTIPVGIPKEHPTSAKVVATTSNIHPSVVVGNKIDFLSEDILLKPGEGIVLQLGQSE